MNVRRAKGRQAAARHKTLTQCYPRVRKEEWVTVRIVQAPLLIIVRYLDFYVNFVPWW